MTRLICISIILIIIMGGCISESPDLTQSDDNEIFPITIENNMGANVTIKTPPQRIISLAPSNTEILFAIGLGEKVVGATEYANYPEEALEIERIGGFNTVNIEKVVSLEPDLILATGGVQAETVNSLRNLGLAVLVIDAQNIGGVLDNILLVGRITENEEKAAKVVGNLSERIEAVKNVGQERAIKPRVTYIVWGDPLIVAGSDNFIDDLINLSGGVNVFSKSSIQYPQISVEGMINVDPQVIITGEHTAQDIRENKEKSEWRGISAVKNGRLYTIDADIITRQGPRIVDALELFSKWIGEVEE
jgi:iron complex transport system substrate-binding protein